MSRDCFWNKIRLFFPKEFGYELRMKKLIFAISLITTFSASACPDLGGNYQVCSSRNGILEEGSLSVKQIPVPYPVFHFSMNGEEITFAATGWEQKHSWSADGVKYEHVMFGKCLGNLLQAHTEILADGEAHVKETSQYYRQGKDLVRISRGVYPSGERYFDILTCR